MRWSTEIFVAVLCVLPIYSSVFVASPCTIVKVFMNEFGQSKEMAANWACIAKYVSGFNTQAVGENYDDGSNEFGIFQIGEKYCKKNSKMNCGVGCSDLVTNVVSNSATCAMSIYKKEGFDYWPTWKKNCKGHDVSKYISKCEVNPKRRRRRRR